MLCRMTYANPERLREGKNEGGQRVVEREPGHAHRPARTHEVNCWWEEINPVFAALAVANGATVIEHVSTKIVRG